MRTTSVSTALLGALLAATTSAASLQQARELFLSDIPASWKQGLLVLRDLGKAPGVEDLRVLATLYGLGTGRDPGAAISRAMTMHKAGQAGAEVLRHAGAAAAGGLPDRPATPRVGLELLDAAASKGDAEAAVLAGAFRLSYPKVASSGRAQLDAAGDSDMARIWQARTKELGLGGPQDLPGAAQLLKALGAPDSAAGLEKVALQRLRRRGDLVPEASAIPWLRWAAAAGSADAAEELGRMYRGAPSPTPGVTKDSGRAMTWYRRAHLAGSKGISAKISQLLLDFPALKRPEATVQRDLVGWAEAQAGIGFPEAQAMLAVAYETGARGLPEDQAKAEAAYRGLAGRKHPRADALMTRFQGTRAMITLAAGAGLHPTQVQAAIPGDVRARFAVGLAFTKTPPKDGQGQAAYDLARQWLDRICQSPIDPALKSMRAGSCQRVADLLRRDGGGADQVERVRRTYISCSEAGSAECARLVADTYGEVPLWKGAPTQPDPKQYRAWTKKAAKGGDKTAKKRWKDLNKAPGFFDNLGTSAMWGLLILALAGGAVAFFLAGDDKKSRRRY